MFDASTITPSAFFSSEKVIPTTQAQHQKKYFPTPFTDSNPACYSKEKAIPEQIASLSKWAM